MATTPANRSDLETLVADQVAPGALAHPLDNPLAEGLEHLPVDPTTMVIFGATGDLAQRKLLPAIYNLAHEGALPERFNLVGFALDEHTDHSFRDLMHASVSEFSRTSPKPEVLQALLFRVRYVSGTFDDPDDFASLAKVLEEFDVEADEPLNHLFYLATAPPFFSTVTKQLGASGLNHKEGAEVHVVVEKPIGRDLVSARALNEDLLSVLDESQVFRIDHYLGKETVQNIMAFRFANAMFEPIWNSNYVDCVQITVAEDLGVGMRAGYYDTAGALRDLVQNHMLQLLALLCMEPPNRLTANKVRDEKAKVLNAIRPPEFSEVPQMAVRGQYTRGTIGSDTVPGYLEEPGVPAGSHTETYAALRLEVSNWRWAGVPIYLRTGKRLARKVTEIAVRLKPVPHLAFQVHGAAPTPNQLVFQIQPNEGVSLSLGAKVPGAKTRIRPVNMQFQYGTSFVSQSPEAYERLILDVMRGDATLFTRVDEVEALWSIVDPVLAFWEADPAPPAQYAAGTEGPEEAGRLLQGGLHWRPL
ncbi:MAG: glucose-6-phosphate dehydrogenase [Solirubrobacterales bacterium]